MQRVPLCYFGRVKSPSLRQMHRVLTTTSHMKIQQQAKERAAYLEFHLLIIDPKSNLEIIYPCMNVLEA